jgi:hypothetical protein
MKGHMRERSGGWELRIYAGRDPVTRRKRYPKPYGSGWQA